MAHYIPSETGELRGSQGGTTFSRDRAGCVARARIGRGFGPSLAALRAQQDLKVVNGQWTKETPQRKELWNKAAKTIKNDKKALFSKNCTGKGWFTFVRIPIAAIYNDYRDYGDPLAEAPAAAPTLEAPLFLETEPGGKKLNIILRCYGARHSGGGAFLYWISAQSTPKEYQAKNLRTIRYTKLDNVGWPQSVVDLSIHHIDLNKYKVGEYVHLKIRFSQFTTASGVYEQTLKIHG